MKKLCLYELGQSKVVKLPGGGWMNGWTDGVKPGLKD
jgi:hypothetical protein